MLFFFVFVWGGCVLYFVVFVVSCIVCCVLRAACSLVACRWLLVDYS